MDRGDRGLRNTETMRMEDTRIYSERQMQRERERERQRQRQRQRHEESNRMSETNQITSKPCLIQLSSNELNEGGYERRNFFWKFIFHVLPLLYSVKH